MIIKNISLIIICLCVLVFLILLIFVFVCYKKAKAILKKNLVINIYNEKKNKGNFCKYEEFPMHFETLLILVEDSKFFKHKGFNIFAIIRAIIINIKRKKIILGGSTITQQLAKNLYLNSKKTFYRKMVEFFITLNIEKELTKIQILELYINVVYYGNGQYGIYNAVKYYFNKEFKDLSVNQSFFLITLLSSPSRLNPYIHKEAFINAKNRKLERIKFDKIDKRQYELIKSYTVDNIDAELQKRKQNI